MAVSSLGWSCAMAEILKRLGSTRFLELLNAASNELGRMIGVAVSKRLELPSIQLVVFYEERLHVVQQVRRQVFQLADSGMRVGMLGDGDQPIIAFPTFAFFLLFGLDCPDQARL